MLTTAVLRFPDRHLIYTLDNIMLIANRTVSSMIVLQKAWLLSEHFLDIFFFKGPFLPIKGPARK